jgi:hypothetical protein
MRNEYENNCDGIKEYNEEISKIDAEISNKYDNIEEDMKMIKEMEDKYNVKKNEQISCLKIYQT